MPSTHLHHWQTFKQDITITFLIFPLLSLSIYLCLCYPLSLTSSILHSISLYASLAYSLSLPFPLPPFSNHPPSLFALSLFLRVLFEKTLYVSLSLSHPLFPFYLSHTLFKSTLKAFQWSSKFISYQISENRGQSYLISPFGRKICRYIYTGIITAKPIYAYIGLYKIQNIFKKLRKINFSLKISFRQIAKIWQL